VVQRLRKKHPTAALISQLELTFLKKPLKWQKNNDTRAM
jgi:hypothetical protein